LKIAIYLNSAVDSGGGFNQALNAILQMRRVAESHFDFIVVTTVYDNVHYLAQMDIQATYVKATFTDRLTAFFALGTLGRKVQRKLKIVGGLERYLLRQHVDLVYFLEPTSKALSLQKLNYIFTVWDICHRDTPEFPEVRAWNQFLSREQIYHHCLAQALLVIADSPILVDLIVARYGIDQNRLMAMPFSPSPFLENKASVNVDVVQKYNLCEDYFFYPAQFWAHKNHIRILQALLLLKKQGEECNVVFCGSDKGNLDYIRQVINDDGLNGQVKMLGFVPVEDMRNLYQHCRAVVMPSYFGPTNIPPLEAWMSGKPLIYSDIFMKQVGDAAICVDPDSAEELAMAMRKILDSDDLCDELVGKGRMRLQEITLERSTAEDQLQYALLRFEKKRQCWL